MEQLTEDDKIKIRDSIRGIAADMMPLKEAIDDYYFHVENAIQRFDSELSKDEALEILSNTEIFLKNIYNELKSLR